jgi:hypothetical protein
MWAAPSTGTAYSAAQTGKSPRLDFRVEFTQAGTHHLWVRGMAASAADDSVHVGLDGVPSPTADRIVRLPTAYGWTRATADGPVATINVPSPGIHTLNLWMWEDGAIVDRLLLTTSPTFVPTSLGPAESPHTPASLDFTAGFADVTGLQLNGSATSVGGAARLTGPDGFETGSFFSAGEVNVGAFATTFDFRLTSTAADGFAFVIQGVGNTALGTGGNGLGYQGIGSSVAVKFDLFETVAVSRTGLYTNGQTPDGGTDLAASGIDLHSGHVFRTTVAYAGGAFRVSIRDLTTGASATQSYVVDIATVVGGATAFVGFTGATGSLTAVQEILGWGFWA